MKKLFPVIFLIAPAITLATPQISERVLKNGLKILVQEDHRSPVVVSQVWYKVGASYEPNGITGISHMLEHMMFKGTDKHAPGEFSRIIAENGGEENAFTGYDYTAYFQTMAADKLSVSFELEADRMRHLHILPEELKKELEVVTEERRMRTDDNPQAKMAEQFAAMAHTSSPYKNPIIGWVTDIAAYTAPDLQAWYQRWYAPNNATLVVVGDVKTEDVFALAEKNFGELKPSELIPLKPQIEAPQIGTRKMTVKVPAKLPSVLLGYHVPTLKTAKEESEAYALEVLAGVLDGGSSARLSSTLIRGKQIAVEAGAGYNLTSRLDDLFELEATPAQGKTVQDVEAALKAEIMKLQTTLVESAELERIKAQVLATEVYQRDSNFYQAMQLGMLETVGLGYKKANEYVEKINQVTAQQVQEVAKKYLIDDHLNVAYLDPQKMESSTQNSQKAFGAMQHQR